jgi:arginyl-tRNA synthetase
MPADPLKMLSERFVAAIRAAFPGADPALLDPAIAPSRQAKFGDFQSNVAMPLGRALGLPPREVALRISERLDLGDIAEPLTAQSVAGPGFINITLRADALARLLEELDTPDLGIAHADPAQTIVVDLMGVNLAKQVQVWHLRSTVIGDSIARVFERLGHRVIRQNHVGDWGLQIAMVTARLGSLVREGRVDLGAVTLDDLDRMYKEVQSESDADEDGLAAARRWRMGPKAIAELEEQVGGAEGSMLAAKRTLIALQGGDPATVETWKTIARITMDACMAICARLGANVRAEHSAGESSYRDELAPLVADLEQRGIAEASEGALVVKLGDGPGATTPLLVRKSDGAFLYATTDIAGIRRRVQAMHADRVVYVVDARQSLHFQQVFGAARRAGYTLLPGEPAREASLEHAAFGTMLGEDGRPYKSRSGESVKLADMLDEAIARAARSVAEKSPELPAEERGQIAEAVAIAAIKYADLSTERTKDYIFSYDRMMSFEGNTGPYLLYALVRIRSIFRKAAERFGEAAGFRSAPFLVREPEERSLALALLRYPGAVQAVADSLEPHRLTQYLYELAGTFSAFFQACPVLQAPDEAVRNARLRLCDLAARILEDGLGLLGIKGLQRM